MTNHGGARKGAGRPKTPSKLISVRLSPPLFELLEHMRGNIPRSAYIRALIRVCAARKSIPIPPEQKAGNK